MLMKVTDIVSNNIGGNVFVITSMDVSDNSQVLTLVEVNPNKIDEHLYPNIEPILISIQELQVYYTKIS
jgi:gamma-glutamyltranspeptidase